VVVVVGVRVAEMVVSLALMGGSDLGVEVGVMSVGEAMVVLRERGGERVGEILCYGDNRERCIGFLPHGLIVLSLILVFG